MYTSTVGYGGNTIITQGFAVYLKNKLKVFVSLWFKGTRGVTTFTALIILTPKQKEVLFMQDTLQYPAIADDTDGCK
jgi:hypothetical protein